MTAIHSAASTSFIEPMRCLPARTLPVGAEWLYEIEWSGLRAIGSKRGRECHLSSSRGESFDHEFPGVASGLERLRCNTALVDAEIIAWDESGRPSMEELESTDRARILNLVVFDVMMIEGCGLLSKPLWLRRRVLSAIMPPDGTMLFSRELEGEPDVLMNRAQEVKLEGIVAKQRESTYEPGRRSGAWMACKPEIEDCFLVGGFIPGHDGFDELILGERRGGRLRFVARMRAGFLPAAKWKVMERLQPLPPRACPFCDLPERGEPSPGYPLDAMAMSQCQWVIPSVRLNVAFVERTSDGKLCHPRFEGLAEVDEAGLFPP